jgi:sulfate permease, SulP family
MSGRRGAAAGRGRYVPALGWLGGYQGPWLPGDLAAGGTTAAVVIPQAMAYATIAGLPVQAGLYVATVPMLVYALLGSSRPLSVSTTSTLAALTAAAVAARAAAGGRLGILLAVTTGPANRGVALVGTIPPGLPELGLPDLDLVSQLLGPAAGVALMAFVESIAAARAFTGPGEPDVDADQELRALGGANLAGGLFQAFPAGGGLSQTAVNRQAGARTQLAGSATAVVVALTLLFLTPLFEHLPQATLGAVVIVAVTGLVDLAALGRIRRLRVRDFRLALVALAGVLVLGVLQGVLGRRPGSSHWRDLDRHPDGETVPGLLVLRPVASIYFANGPRVRRRLLDLVEPADPPPQVPAAGHAAPPPGSRRLGAAPVPRARRGRGRLQCTTTSRSTMSRPNRLLMTPAVTAVGQLQRCRRA